MKKNLSIIALLLLIPALTFAKPKESNGQSNGNGQANKNSHATQTDTETDGTVTTKKDDQQARREAKQTEKQTQKEENSAARFQKGQEKALAAIDKRTTQLTNLLNRLTERKRIRERERAIIQADITKITQSLQASRAKIEAATDMETLRAELKNAIDSTRVNAVVVPKVRAIAMTSALYNGIDRVNKVFPKVEELIKNNPDKATEANALLAEAKTLLASTQTKADAAWDEFAQMSPTQDFTKAKIHFQTGKIYFQEAKDLLKQSVDKLKQIRALIAPEETTELEEENDADVDEPKAPTPETETEGTAPVTPAPTVAQ